MEPEVGETDDTITPLRGHSRSLNHQHDFGSPTPLSPGTTLIGQPTPSTFVHQPERGRYRFAYTDYFSRWFPRIDPQHRQAKNLSVRFARRESILLTAASVTTVIFCGNLVVLLYFYFKSSYHEKYQAGTTVIHQGDCSRVKQINSALHLLVNILGSGLYLFSQLCMQLITAPTRQQIDEAHKKGDWYDIGILSFRNLFRSGWLSQLICVILFASSWPLHFIYNSVISATNVSEFAYPAVVVSETFSHGAPWGSTFITNVPARTPTDIYNNDIVPGKLGTTDNITVARMANSSLDTTLWNKISSADCLNLYSDRFGLHSNLILVVDRYPNDTLSSMIEYHYIASGVGTSSGRREQKYWICSDGGADGPDCDRRYDFDDTSTRWKKHGHNVSYCLSYNITQSGEGWRDCQIKFSPILMLAVCICILLKCLCIWYCYGDRTLRQGTTLCTLGDAIASFLEKRDDTTAGLNNVTKHEISIHKTDWDFEPKVWSTSQKEVVPWQRTVTQKRLWVTLSIWLITTVFFIIQIILQAVWTRDEGTYETFSAILGIGWGRVDASSIYNLSSLRPTGVSAFISSVLFANYWQLIISLLSLYTISLLACCHVSQEWSSFYDKRKFLRVTHPQGMQRSKYSVSMPLRYGLPFTIAFIALHWFVSQSNFVVQSLAYGGSDALRHTWKPNPTQAGYVTVGYSPAATFTSLLWTLLLFLAVLGLTYLHETQSGMPLAATCSAAISAACHPPSGDYQAHLFPVQWGLIDRAAYDDGDIKSDRWAFTTLFPLRDTGEVQRFGRPWFLPRLRAGKDPPQHESKSRTPPESQESTEGAQLAINQPSVKWPGTPVSHAETDSATSSEGSASRRHVDETEAIDGDQFSLTSKTSWTSAREVQPEG